MAYNNGFPASYQYFPQYQQTYQQNNGIIWVQGEAGAKSYLVAPNTTVQLWDSEAQTIYLKSADASGMPSIKTLDYTIRENTPKMRSNGLQENVGDLSGYATKDEIRAVYGQINALRADIDSLTKHKEGNDE